MAEGGHYYLSVSVEATNSQVDNRLSLNGNGNVQITKLNKISKNGVVFKNANDKQLWIGEDTYILQWGNSYIELNDNGVTYKPKDDTSNVRHHAVGELGSMTKVKHITENSDYYASIYEGILIIDGLVTNKITLYLPAAASAQGKYYFIKNLSGHNITLNCDQKFPAIIDVNSSTPIESKTIAKHYSTTVFCDGQYWMIG